jgi:hypothetical protein
MKKELIFMICLCCMTKAYSQLVVNQNGNVSIQSSEIPLSSLSINGAGRSDYQMALYSMKSGIYAEIADGIAGAWTHGSKFVNHNTGSNFWVGVRADVYPIDYVARNTGRSFGLFGVAGYATPGWNYGVFGRIDGSNNGAAIYGTSDPSDNGSYIDGMYAGYFNGNTKVIGNLTVTGNINGVVLGNASSNSSMAKAQAISTYSSSESIANKLEGLTAMSYYKTSPLKVKVSANIGDTIVAEHELTTIEKQNMSKLHYALSADQLEKNYPDLVYENEDGSKSINYMEMIPLLVQSINELHEKIAKLESTSTKTNTNTTSINNSASTTDLAILYQNSPNPFSAKTSIEFNVPEDAKVATINIYDMTGKQIKQVNASTNGKHSIDIDANELGTGMFLYSFIIDGKLIDTKRMIVTK